MELVTDKDGTPPIDFGKRIAQSWQDDVAHSHTTTQQLRALCRTITYAGEGPDTDDIDKLMTLMDERLAEVENTLHELTGFFGSIESIGVDPDTLEEVIIFKPTKAGLYG